MRGSVCSKIKSNKNLTAGADWKTGWYLTLKYDPIDIKRGKLDRKSLNKSLVFISVEVNKDIEIYSKYIVVIQG